MDAKSSVKNPECRMKKKYPIESLTPFLGGYGQKIEWPNKGPIRIYDQGFEFFQGVIIFRLKIGGGGVLNLGPNFRDVSKFRSNFTRGYKKLPQILSMMCQLYL